MRRRHRTLWHLFSSSAAGPRQKDFDLLKHDVLEYGKSWSELDEDG